MANQDPANLRICQLHAENTPEATTAAVPHLAMIAEQLRPLAVPCTDLLLDPANTRRHPEANLEAIKGSLRVYG